MKLKISLLVSTYYSLSDIKSYSNIGQTVRQNSKLYSMLLSTFVSRFYSLSTFHFLIIFGLSVSLLLIQTPGIQTEERAQI